MAVIVVVVVGVVVEIVTKGPLDVCHFPCICCKRKRLVIIYKTSYNTSVKKHT
jgi:hypothetical protein